MKDPPRPATPPEPAPLKVFDWPMPADKPPRGVATAIPAPWLVVTDAAPAAAPERPWVAAPEMVLAVPADNPPPIASVEPAFAGKDANATNAALKRNFFIWIYPLILPWWWEFYRFSRADSW